MKISNQKARDLTKTLMSKKAEVLLQRRQELKEKAQKEYLDSLPKEIVKVFENENTKKYLHRISAMKCKELDHKQIPFVDLVPYVNGYSYFTFSESFIKEYDKFLDDSKAHEVAEAKLQAFIYECSSPKRILEHFPELKDHEALKEPIKAIVNISDIKKLYKEDE